MSCKYLQALLPASESCFSTELSAHEKGKTFRFITNLKGDICKLKVDGCLISSQTVPKCDYLFYSNSGKEFYFVELKGTDIEKAFEQICATIKHVNTIANIQIKKNKIHGFVVSSAVPAAANQRVRHLQAKFARDIGTRLYVKNRLLEHSV